MCAHCLDSSHVLLNNVVTSHLAIVCLATLEEAKRLRNGVFCKARLARNWSSEADTPENLHGCFVKLFGK